MDEALARGIERLKADRTSGASELIPLAIETLRAAARGRPGELAAAARAVGEAQPSMASFWNLALAALAGETDPGALERFAARWQRAGAAMVRVAVDELAPPVPATLSVATWSFSGSVLACLAALARRAHVRVSCAEGRPSLEGRRLAAALARERIPVDLFTDAGLGEALCSVPPAAGLVLVGADAVAPGWIVNKAGTGMVAAAAARAGIPVYVAATRDKFVDARVAGLLRFAGRDPLEVWDAAPEGVGVRNVPFERVPIDLVSAVITDAGTLAGGMIAEACRAASAGLDDGLVGRLAARPPSVP